MSEQGGSGKLVRGSIAQAAVWTLLVVLLPPRRDLPPRIASHPPFTLNPLCPRPQASTELSEGGKGLKRRPFPLALLYPGSHPRMELTKLVVSLRERKLGAGQ